MPLQLWKRDDQTQGKHLVLQRYLNGWFPILGQSNDRLLFVDGFAGPGEYADGEQGSPLIALDCVRLQKNAGRLDGVNVICLFIEEDNERADHLRRVLDGRTVPDTESIVISGTFDANMTEILDFVEQARSTLVPSFVMIDPFGVKDVSMKLVERVLRNPKSECMISFMRESIRRWRNRPDWEKHLDGLFGTAEWRDARTMDEVCAMQFLHDLFEHQLKCNGAKFVVPFELWRGNRHIYTLYFTSGHLKGCNLMKASIWTVEPSGSYEFHNSNQLRILFPHDRSRLEKELRDKFGKNPTPIEHIEKFVMGDETIFHKGHLRKETLSPLEKEGRITVERPAGVKKGAFPLKKGVVVTF